MDLLEAKKPPDGYMWSNGRTERPDLHGVQDVLTRKQLTSRPDHLRSLARTLGENGKECQAEGEAKVVT